jgi:cell division protein FtsB
MPDLDPDVRDRAVEAAYEAFSSVGVGEARWTAVVDAVAEVLAAEQPERLQDRADKRFAYLRTLEQNWDSYGSDPLQPGMEERARKVLKALSADFSICLTANGGICLEDPNMDVIIEIEPNEVTALIDDRDLEEDGGVRAENKALKEQNERLRDRRDQLKARVEQLTAALTEMVLQFDGRGFNATRQEATLDRARAVLSATPTESEAT